jgi:hypothetical protein
MMRMKQDVPATGLNDDERNLLLAALFELSLTRSAFDHDPDAEQVPFTRIHHDDILSLVDKLDGQRDTALFGAFRDAWDDAPAPEYPAETTDEG